MTKDAEDVRLALLLIEQRRDIQRTAENANHAGVPLLGQIVSFKSQRQPLERHILREDVHGRSGTVAVDLIEAELRLRAAFDGVGRGAGRQE